MAVVSIDTLKEYREYKKDVVMKFLTSFFRDEEESSGNSLELPYFIKAKNAYNEMIKNNKDLTKYYNKIKGKEK